jgi:hypothetical protein
MKKTHFSIISVLIMLFVALPSVSAQGAQVSFTGGRVQESTILTKANGPYLITSTIEIPSGITLTIEPGVQIDVRSQVNLFWVQGKLVIRGSKESPVRIDGTASNYFYLKGARTAEVEAKFLLINGSGTGSLIPATGYEQNASLNFEDCEFINIPGFNYIWYPNAANFSRNVFWKTAGFSTGTSNAAVIFKNNLFLGDPIKVEDNSYWIDVWNGSTLVNLSGNEFRDLTKNAIVGKVSFSAKGNYWNGLGVSQIPSYILDNNDSLNFPGIVDYSGQLTQSPNEVPKTSALVQEYKAKEAEAKAASELKARQEAEAKDASEKAAAELKAKQELDAKAATEKAAAEVKAKQDADAKAAAALKARQEAEAKAKQEADAKAAAEKVLADAKAQAAKIIADAKAKAMMKTSITCIKGNLTKKVTAVNPKCPAGYKKK